MNGESTQVSWQEKGRNWSQLQFGKARRLLLALTLMLALLAGLPGPFVAQPAAAAAASGLPAQIADAPLQEQVVLPAALAQAESANQSAMTRLRLYEGENNVISSVLDVTNGYAYFGLDSSPGKIIKMRLSDFTRVDTLVLADDEDHVGTGVLDAAHGYAYFGVNSSLGSKIIQVRLSDFTRVADLPMQTVERWITEGVIDTANGYAYFTIQHLTEAHRLIQVRLSDFTRVGQLNYGTDAIPFSAAIDTTNGYIYLGMNSNAVTRVRLSDFTPMETRYFWGYGASVYAAAVDPVGGYAYFGTDCYLLRYRLSDFTYVDNIALDFYGAYTLSLDAAHGYLYASHVDKFGGADKIFKIRLADFVSEGSLTLVSAEKTVWTAILDDGAGTLYLGTKTRPGIIVKVDLSTFTRVGALTLEPGSPYPYVPVIDTTNGYAYYGNVNTYPGRIYKVRLSDFSHVGTLVLTNNSDSDFQSAAIDVAGGYAYYGTDTEPGRIVRIRLSDFTHDGTLTLASGENDLDAVAIDPDNGYAYFGTATNPARIVKVDLATFTRVGAITLPSEAGGWIHSGFVDAANGLAYFATESKVVKIDLVTFTYVDALAHQAGSGWYPNSVALFDPLNGYGYFNLVKNSTEDYGRIFKVDLATFTQAAMLEFPGERDFAAGAIDPSGGYLYMSTSVIPAHFLTVRLSDGSVVNTAAAEDDDEYSPRGAVIDPQAGYVYFGLYTPPTGTIIRMSLYQEPGEYCTFLPLVQR